MHRYYLSLTDYDFKQRYVTVKNKNKLNLKKILYLLTRKAKLKMYESKLPDMTEETMQRFDLDVNKNLKPH